MTAESQRSKADELSKMDLVKIFIGSTAWSIIGMLPILNNIVKRYHRSFNEKQEPKI
jgi:hypothetical protein